MAKGRTPLRSTDFGVHSGTSARKRLVSCMAEHSSWAAGETSGEIGEKSERFRRDPVTAIVGVLS
jgi:hypothetical protein